MDYGKLTNISLKELLDDREIKYNANTNKEGLIDLLEHNDERKQSPVEYSTIETSPKAGAITTIVLSSMTLIFGFWVVLWFVFLLFVVMFSGGDDGQTEGWMFLILLEFILLFIFFIGPIISIVVNIRYIKGKNNKVSAGVWGLLFGGIIGGILTLCGV